MSNSEGLVELHCSNGHTFLHDPGSDSEVVVIKDLLKVRCPHCLRRNESEVAATYDGAQALALVQAFYRLFNRGDELPITVEYNVVRDLYTVRNIMYPEKFWNVGDDLSIALQGDGVNGFNIPMETIQLFSVTELDDMGKVGWEAYKALFQCFVQVSYQVVMDPQNAEVLGTQVLVRGLAWKNSGLDVKARETQFEMTYQYAATEVARKGGKMWGKNLPTVLFWNEQVEIPAE